MGFSAGVGFLVDTDGNGTNDGKVVTLKQGSNISLSLTGSTLTISGSGSGGSGSMTTVQSAGSQVGGADIVTLNFGSEFGITETSDTLIAVTIDDATTSAKGKASFSSANFAVSSGAVTIKDGGVDLAAEVTGTLPVANGGTGATSLDNLIALGQHTTGSFVGKIIGGTGIDTTGASSGEEIVHTLSIDSTVATKTYVDSVAQGLRVSDPVAVATTGSITLSGEQTIDGILTSTSRVLVKDQGDGSKNGIYVSAAGSWARATDMNSSTPNEFPGTFVFVTGGTTNADTGFVCTVDTDFVLDSDDVSFSQFSSAGHITAGTLLDKSGNTLNVDLSEAAAAVMAEADEFVFLDTGSSSAASRETLSDLLDTIAGTVGTTGLDRSGATLVVSDLHPVGVSGANNQLLTDDGDGTVTSESGLTFDGDDLKILGTASGKPTLTLENSTSVAGAAGEPEVIFLRSGASSAATSGDLGRIIFKGLDSADNLHTYAQITGEALDETSGTEDGRLRFLAEIANKDDGSGGTLVGTVEFLRLAGAEGIVFNTDGEDINFRVESDDDPNMFVIDAGTNKIGIGTNSPAVDLEIRDTTASSATQGGGLRLSSDDGALMATGHRLGVIEFAGAEDDSSTMRVGGRIEVLCDGAWSGSANAANMIFYTTTGNATQSEVMRLSHDKAITTQGGITVQTGASSGQKALYLRHQDADVYALEIATDNTTANVVNISANDVTTATVFNIDSGAVGVMTTGKVIDAKGSYTIADGGTVTSNRLYTTLVGTATQTNTASLSYVKKVGATASGKTSTVTALEAWGNDGTANDASGTSIVRGVYGKASFTVSNQGTTSTFGGVFEVSGADNNYGVQVIGGSLLLGTLSAAPADISTYGQLWVKDNGSGAANTELYFTNDNGDDIQITDGSALAASSLAFTTIAVSGQSNVVADGATDTLTFAAGSNIAITTDAGGDQVTISATGTISGGITVQEEGSALSNLADTLNFVGSSVTATGTGTTKTITISGGGAFARSSNIIKTTETIGIGGSNVEEFALSDGGAVNSEAIMQNNGTNASVTTHGMGMRKNITIVVPDAATGDDTYTVADTDHIIMLCNVNPTDSTANGSQIIRHVQMPTIGTNYVGREITVTLHAVSGLPTDNITVKPAADDVILYHGRMWDNNMSAGNHNGVGSSTGGDGMTMGHAAAIDMNWSSLGQMSVISVTMVAVDHGRLAALLNANPVIPITQDPSRWTTGTDSITSDVWLVTSVSGVNIPSQNTGYGMGLAETGLGFENFLPRIG